jgi:hypothetical protein
MRRTHIKLYLYEELTDEVKAKVRERWRTMAQEAGDCVAPVSEEFQYQLEQLGYPTDKVYWSLGYCQGDGMAFYGRVDPACLPKIRNRVLGLNSKARSLTDTFLSEVEVEIEDRNVHYNHWNSMQVSAEARTATERQCELIKELVEAIDADIKEVSKRLEHSGYEIIEDMETDASVDENISIQEWEFFEDGRQFNESWEDPLTPDEAAEAAGQQRLIA